MFYNYFRNLLLCAIFATSGTLHAEETEEQRPDWQTYFEHTIDASTPHLPLLQALHLFESEGKKSGFAIDLGCGTGRDTLYLLNLGWNVLAVDGEELAIEILLNRTDSEVQELLQVMCAPFAKLILPSEADLINASLCLPFCAPDVFPALWEHITESIAIGGRFSGHFFGDHDEWASLSGRTHHTREEVMQLFEERYEIEYFNVLEDDCPCADGTIKHWHVFSVVAKKISG